MFKNNHLSRFPKVITRKSAFRSRNSLLVIGSQMIVAIKGKNALHQLSPYNISKSLSHLGKTFRKVISHCCNICIKIIDKLIIEKCRKFK